MSKVALQGKLNDHIAKEILSGEYLSKSVSLVWCGNPMLQKKLVVQIITILLGVFFFSVASFSQPTVRVAVIQLDSTKAGDFDAMTNFAMQAKERGAELVIFPESSAFGWLNPKVFTDADSIPGKTAAKFASVAKSANVWVAAGLAERGPKIQEV